MEASNLAWTRTHLVDVWQNTSSGDGGSDQDIELFVSSNSELQVSGSDTLHSEIFGGVTWSQGLSGLDPWLPIQDKDCMGRGSIGREGWREAAELTGNGETDAYLLARGLPQ